MPLFEVAILGHHPDGHEELMLAPKCIVAPNEETAGVLASTKLPKCELIASARLEVLVRRFEQWPSLRELAQTCGASVSR